jgi:hypothetical protein
MPSHRLTLSTPDVTLPILLEGDRAPRTANALLASLGSRIDLHCAKIAGNHILWHAPFVVDAEATGDVMQVPPGGFLYWPERQFLELVFDALQAESAQVTLLGRLESGIDDLRSLGRHVQERQGHQPLYADLASRDPVPAFAPKPSDPALAGLVAARRRLWQGPPAEITALMTRRGVMLPTGPLIYAEGYARNLHEALWRLRAIARGGDPDFAARAAVEAIALAVSRIAGFCHLLESGAVLTQAAELLRARSDLAAAIIDETILISGRLAAWLDGRIAWNDLTAATRAAASEWKEPT